MRLRRLTLHEYGHARSALALGDDTALKAGRVTLNPAVHLDPLGMLMVVLVGFGYARPVPINPQQMRSTWAPAAVAAAGPGMNLLLAVVCINGLAWGLGQGSLSPRDGLGLVLLVLAQINILLALFNLIPLGPLDGHYIFSWLLPPPLARRYDEFNWRYGSWLFLGLIMLSIAGVPVFRALTQFSNWLLQFLTFF